jgi:hypothetical protein
MKTMYIVSDIDGTVADISHRVKYLIGADKNWGKFFAAMNQDTVIFKNASILLELSNYGIQSYYELVFCTGRPEIYRTETESWLATNVHAGHTVLMRKDGDYRSDSVIKPELLREAGITPENTLFILEDRNRVVMAYRDLGYNVFQVAEGDY